MIEDTNNSASQPANPLNSEDGNDPIISSHVNSQTNTDIQFGNILKDYGLDTDQDGRFDQLVIEVEVTSAVKGKYQLSGQLLAGEKPFRGQNSINLALENRQSPRL